MAQTFPDLCSTWDFHLQKASCPSTTFQRPLKKASESLSHRIAHTKKKLANLKRNQKHSIIGGFGWKVDSKKMFSLPWLTAQSVPPPTAASPGRRLPHSERSACRWPWLHLLMPGSCRRQNQHHFTGQEQAQKCVFVPLEQRDSTNWVLQSV